MSAVRYATEQERVEARRLVWRGSGRRKRDRIRRGIACAEVRATATPEQKCSPYWWVEQLGWEAALYVELLIWPRAFSGVRQKVAA